MTFSIACSTRSDSRARDKIHQEKKNRGDQPCLLPEWVRWSAQEFPPFVPLEKVLVLAIYGNRSLINQSCLVKIAAWILSWFFSVLLLKSTSSQSTKEFKLGQYPAILTLVDNAYILQQITGTLEPGGLGKVLFLPSNPQHCSISGRGGIQPNNYLNIELEFQAISIKFNICRVIFRTKFILSKSEVISIFSRK